ncbi:Uncharacterised protein [Mycobacteroides abscessus subsp. massiliense]|nr:Uncharacterised protein [Mycobacteroides abscessus subsp. abscessus]SLF01060.1 Uncharacterised protein [Mycobacteroides abscessus subsp. massiliense]
MVSARLAPSAESPATFWLHWSTAWLVSSFSWVSLSRARIALCSLSWASPCQSVVGRPPRPGSRPTATGPPANKRRAPRNAAPTAATHSSMPENVTSRHHPRNHPQLAAHSALESASVGDAVTPHQYVTVTICWPRTARARWRTYRHTHRDSGDHPPAGARSPIGAPVLGHGCHPHFATIPKSPPGATAPGRRPRQRHVQNRTG